MRLRFCVWFNATCSAVHCYMALPLLLLFRLPCVNKTCDIFSCAVVVGYTVWRIQCCSGSFTTLFHIFVTPGVVAFLFRCSTRFFDTPLLCSNASSHPSLSRNLRVSTLSCCALSLSCAHIPSFWFSVFVFFMCNGVDLHCSCHWVWACPSTCHGLFPGLCCTASGSEPFLHALMPCIVQTT